MRHLGPLPLGLLVLAAVGGGLLMGSPSSTAQSQQDDGDGYWWDDEVAKGSDPTDPNSTPEHCDGIDNDGDTTVDEPPVGSGRPTPDPECDPAADTDGDTIPNGSDPDDDNDLYSDVHEQWMSTDELADCPVTSGVHDAWPPDIDKNRVINITDIGKILPPVFGMTGNRRYDFAWPPDEVVNISDLGKLLPPNFATICTLPTIW